MNAGEVHAIMGPNGSGKSTLARALSGHPDYEVTDGVVIYDGKDLLAMDPDERAREGVFMAFQYPVEIPGVNNAYFLKAALNAMRKHRGLAELDAMEFMTLVQEKAEAARDRQVDAEPRRQRGLLGRREEAQRDLPDGVLEPRLAILDETDSGLDIDALKLVADGVNAMRAPERAFIVVTHYQRLLELHRAGLSCTCSADGRIVKSGGKELALELEEKGYGWLEASCTTA